MALPTPRQAVVVVADSPVWLRVQGAIPPGTSAPPPVMTPVTRTPHSCRQRGNRGVSLPSRAPNGVNGVPQVPHRSPGRSGLSGWLYYNGNRPIWALTGGGRAQNCGSFACCRQQTGPQTTQRQTWGTCWLLGTGGGRCGLLQEKPLPPQDPFTFLRFGNRIG